MRNEILEEAAKIVDAECERVLSKQIVPTAHGSDADVVNTNLRMIAVLLPDIAASIRSLKQPEAVSPLFPFGPKHPRGVPYVLLGCPCAYCVSQQSNSGPDKATPSVKDELLAMSEAHLRAASDIVPIDAHDTLLAAANTIRTAIARAKSAGVGTHVESFTLDLCEGQTVEQIKASYRRLTRAVGRLQSTLLFLVGAAPEAVDKIPEPYRGDVKRLISAYDDDAPTLPPSRESDLLALLKEAKPYVAAVICCDCAHCNATANLLSRLDAAIGGGE